MSVDEFMKLWKIAKAAYEMNEISEGPAAQVAQLSKEMDRLIVEFQNNPSDQRLRAMREEVGKIIGKLETLAVVSPSMPTPGIKNVQKVALWFAKLELDLLAADFAKQELIRIAFEQSEGGLPPHVPDLKQRWRTSRSAMLRVAPLYKTVANQMAAASLNKQREIEKSFENQKAALQAIEEVRRQNPPDAADQFGMINLDMLGFVDDLHDAVVIKLRFEAIGKWAVRKSEETGYFVAAMDSLYLN